MDSVGRYNKLPSRNVVFPPGGCFLWHASALPSVQTSIITDARWRKAVSFTNFSNVHKLTKPNLNTTFPVRKSRVLLIIGKSLKKKQMGGREQRGVRLTSSRKCSTERVCVWVCLGRYKFLMILHQDQGWWPQRTRAGTLPAGKVLSHRTHSPTCVWMWVLSCSLECFLFSVGSRGVCQLLLFWGLNQVFFWDFKKPSIFFHFHAVLNLSNCF